MQIIDDNTVVVYSSSELKQVLSEANNYNYVYLGNDISLESGFTINANKINVTIDGTYLKILHYHSNTQLISV